MYIQRETVQERAQEGWWKGMRETGRQGHSEKGIADSGTETTSIPLLGGTHRNSGGGGDDIDDGVQAENSFVQVASWFIAADKLFHCFFDALGVDRHPEAVLQVVDEVVEIVEKDKVVAVVEPQLLGTDFQVVGGQVLQFAEGLKRRLPTAEDEMVHVDGNLGDVVGEGHVL
jgi:hypothetical protein